MSKLIIRSLALLCIVLSINPKNVSASHAAGAELVYEWVSDSTYNFYFKFYRDCTGIDVGSTVTMCMHDPCNNNSSSVVLSPVTTLPDGRPNGSPVSAGCPNFKNTCEDMQSTLPSYREWWYAGSAIIPDNSCNNWRFGVSISARNLSQNLATSGNLYVEATLNNIDFPHNSSAVFYTKPVPYVCINTPFTYNNGAIDKDKDVLVYESILPIIGINSTTHCAQPLNPAVLNTGQTPPLALPSNPFQTNGTYSLNAATGNISYTPSQLGAQATAIRVKEYRNGILVGSTIRDIQVQVQNCNNTGINMELDTNSISNAVYNNGQIETCINKSISFCFNIDATIPGSIISVTDNSGLSIPTASITYSNNKSDTVRGCVSWTTSISDTGLHIITISAKDSTCNPPGVSVTQVYTIPVKVNATSGIPNVVSPVDLCQYEAPVTLTANGVDVLWYNSSFGGIGSPTPPSYPTNTVASYTFYASHSPNGCRSDRAPIQVNVFDSPEIYVKAEKDTICMFEDLIISDTVTQIDSLLFSWTVDSGRVLDGKFTQKITADWLTEGTKTIILSASKNQICYTRDSIEVYVKRSPIASYDIEQNICKGKATKLTVVEENALYQWSVDEQSITDNTYQELYYLTWQEPGTKKINLILTAANGCVNNLLDTITVHNDPLADISILDQDLCLGDRFTLSTPEGSRYRYNWSPPQYFQANNSNEVNGTVEAAGYYKLKVTDQWGCTNEDSILLSVVACCDIFMPDAFTPNGDGNNDTYGAPEINRHRLLDFTIAHRRGNIVFQTSNPNTRWDGTYKGKILDVGTYSYYIKYICKGEEVFKSGMFHLLR